MTTGDVPIVTCSFIGDGGIREVVSPPLAPNDDDHWRAVARPERLDGHIMQTLGGRWLDLVSPDANLIDFRTISTVLARIPRYTGHTDRGVLSVGQHCLEGAWALRRAGHHDAAAAFLIHDAHEAYMGDIGIPTVLALVALANLEAGDLGAGEVIRRAVRGLKRNLDVAIHLAAGITYPLPHDVAALVKEYDARMLRTERDKRMAPTSLPWAPVYEAAEPIEGVDLYPWSTDTVATLYRQAAKEMLPACKQ